MAATKKKPGDGYHHGDLRRALLDAALATVVRDGPSALSLREVARRAGVSHAAPYRHFANREAMVAALAEEGFRELHRRMEERAGPARDARARLVAVGEAYVTFAVDHPAHFFLMFGEPVDPALHTGLAGAAEPTYLALTDAIAACQKEGTIRPGGLEELSVSAWSIVHGASMLLIARRLGPLDAATAARLVCRDLFDGLSPRAPGKSKRRG